MKQSIFLSLLVGAALALPASIYAAAQGQADSKTAADSSTVAQAKSTASDADSGGCTAGVRGCVDPAELTLEGGPGSKPIEPEKITDPNTPPLTTKVDPIDGLTYVWIPPGKFEMGCSPGDKECDEDEKPEHEVTIARGFWIGQTPVTQAAYERVMGKNPSFFHGSDQLPVEKVDWGDALRYCTKVGMRMPSEREYEYAARGGDPDARYGELEDIAWYQGNSNGHTHPVGEKLPNGYKLYDMLGDVWEYTNDPFNPQDPVFVAMRGGGWVTSAQGIRASFRGFDAADVERKFSGFRCVGD